MYNLQNCCLYGVPQNSPKVLGTVGWKFDFELGLNFGINKINLKFALFLGTYFFLKHTIW